MGVLVDLTGAESMEQNAYLGSYSLRDDVRQRIIQHADMALVRTHDDLFRAVSAHYDPMSHRSGWALNWANQMIGSYRMTYNVVAATLPEPDSFDKRIRVESAYLWGSRYDHTGNTPLELLTIHSMQVRDLRRKSSVRGYIGVVNKQLLASSYAVTGMRLSFFDFTTIDAIAPGSTMVFNPLTVDAMHRAAVLSQVDLGKRSVALEARQVDPCVFREETIRVIDGELQSMLDLIDVTKTYDGRYQAHMRSFATYQAQQP